MHKLNEKCKWILVGRDLFNHAGTWKILCNKEVWEGQGLIPGVINMIYCPYCGKEIEEAEK